MRTLLIPTLLTLAACETKLPDNVIDCLDGENCFDTGLSDTDDTNDSDTYDDTNDTSDTTDTSDTSDTNDTSDTSDTSDPNNIDDDGDGLTENQGDCDDTNPDIYTGAPETCDGVDNNCTGDESDASDAITYYQDSDGDGYGDAYNVLSSCDPVSGYVSDNTDCNDNDSDITPVDGDGDGLSACDGDCDDSNGAVTDDCTYDSYSGYEIFKYHDGTYGQGQLNCQIYWDVASTSSGSNCSTCEFEFELDLTYDASQSTDDGACTGVDVDTSFSYAYDDDYNGYGSSLLYDGSLWIYDGATTYGTTQVVNLTGSSFTYKGGYEDYYYQSYGYLTSIYEGNGALGLADPNIDNDGDGFSVADGDCDDGDASLNPSDADGDGLSTCDGDCDDADADLNLSDADGDGLSTCDGDCDDTDPLLTTNCGSSSSFGSYSGTEIFRLNDGTYGAGQYNCELFWDVVSTGVGSSCTTCEFEFDLDLTYDANQSYDDGACSQSIGDLSFSYAYDDDYNGYGSSLLYDGSLWIYDGNTSYGTTQVVNLTNTSFTYKGGFEDYYYQSYGYLTNIYEGNGTLATSSQTSDNDGDGFSVADGDCDDNDASLNLSDADGDGLSTCAGDCDDTDPTLTTNCGSSSSFGNYSGFETFKLNDGTYGQGQYNCELYWSAVSTATGSSCSSCEFEFDLALTYDASQSYDDGTCAGSDADTSFTYAYDDDYNGYGPALLYNGSIWIYDGDTSGNTTQVVNLSNTTFTYKGGYEDYAYYQSYYTQVFDGGATLSP